MKNIFNWISAAIQSHKLLMTEQYVIDVLAKLHILNVYFSTENSNRSWSVIGQKLVCVYAVTSGMFWSSCLSVLWLAITWTVCLMRCCVDVCLMVLLCTYRVISVTIADLFHMHFIAMYLCSVDMPRISCDINSVSFPLNLPFYLLVTRSLLSLLPPGDTSAAPLTLPCRPHAVGP